VAAALIAPALFAFVRSLLQRPLRYAGWILGETLFVALLSLFTGLVDRAEAVEAGLHITTYGVLFPLYLLHILVFILPALYQALHPDAHTLRRPRQQAQLVGVGLLVTAVVGITTNLILPFFFGNFRFIDVGTLSTVCALGAITYAACFRHLFNIRVVIRATLVFALLIAFALELYQAAVEALTKLLPLGDPTERHIAAASVALIINAFTHEPLWQWLEQLADRLLAHKKRHHQHSALSGRRPH
jgi:hypothetical protein